MRDFVNAVRSFFGQATPDPTPDPTWAEQKLADQDVRQKAIIAAMDAQVDAQRTSVTILDKRRRAGDQR